MNDAPLWSLTAAALVAGFAVGRFTPVDALGAVLARLDAVNPMLNAVIAVDRAGAMAAAEAAAARWRAGAALSTLDGVPITIKDNLFLAGLPATWGSRLYAGFVPDHDEPAVARLRAAGGVLFGKTNVPEFTVQGYTSNLVFGTTFNPHAPGRTPGGSTGGGAAAVAGGVGPIAIGTDGGGSLRRPAAHCGLFAFKPSTGQVARYDGFPQIMSDFEVIGAIARSPEDLAATHGILSGYDPADPRSLASGVALPPWPERLRIAFMPRIGTNPVDPRIAQAAARMARRLEVTGATVETIDVPFDPDRVGAAWAAIPPAGLAWHLATTPGWAALVNPSARAMAEAGAAVSAGQVLDALAVTGELRRAAASLFGRYDLMLCPAIAALAWPAEDVFPPEIDGQAVGPRGHAVFTAWMNIAGLPAATVPVAMTAQDGGIGLQFVAAHGRDRDLLAFLRQSSALADFSPAPLARLDDTPHLST
jgi:aspartyl-tRNA(Asn)/glutamyl-tRNA(Gln) amidotransferase subunit A